MISKAGCLVLFFSLLILLPISQIWARDLLVATRTGQSQAESAPSKLSPALRATIDANGVLKGSDNLGHLVISCADEHLDALRHSRAVVAVMSEMPAQWNPVSKLKLSYSTSAKPTGGNLESLGLKLIEDYEKGPFLIVEPFNKEIDAKLASALENSPSIQYVTPTLRIKAIPPTNPVNQNGSPPAAVGPPTNDPRWSELWGMRSIKAPEAWKKVHDSPDVVVAVIDTGVDYNHEDLKSNIWNDGHGKHGKDFVDNDDDPMDLNGHGTHCSGTIGAIGNNAKGVVGVTWKVQIMGVRWLDASGVGEIANAIKAIDFAVEHGAKILSNSWFWAEDDPDLEAAIKRANDAHVLFVVAASNFALRPNNNDGDNDKTDTFGRYPSAYGLDNIIAVAAIDEAENKADFSNFGKKTVNIGAPGVLILSTVPNDSYDGTYSGTSMATPHVTGALALTMAFSPQSDCLAVKKLVLDHARKIPTLKDRCTTGGTLDISFIH